jgi:hypothetical protein
MISDIYDTFSRMTTVVLIPILENSYISHQSQDEDGVEVLLLGALLGPPPNSLPVKKIL